MERVKQMKEALDKYMTKAEGYPASESFALGVLESALAQITNESGVYREVLIEECIRFAAETTGD
jgi:hypothetical protein